MSVTKENVASEPAIIRLRRDHKTVARLLAKMKSYRLEPKSHDGFVLMQQIKKELISLYNDQRVALFYLEDPKTTIFLKNHFKDFNQRFKIVESKIAEYLIQMS